MSKMIFNGLEFVAGQEINNNGMFVDTSNVIVPTTTFTSSMSYTATSDCIVALSLTTMSSSSVLVKIDGVIIQSGYIASGNNSLGYSVNIKKGQVLTISGANSSSNSAYTVYGLQSGSHNSVKYGTTDPTDSSYDGDTYIVLDSNNKYKGLYLYMSNQWVLIDGMGGNEFEDTIEWSNELFGGSYGHSHNIPHVGTIQVVDAWYNWGNGWVESLTNINGYSGTYSADENKIYFSYSYFDASPNRRYRVKVRYTTD